VIRTVARSPLTWLASLVVLYLALPLVAFVVRFARAPTRGFGVPGLLPSLWVSIAGATISLAVITLLGVPLAYLLARSTSRVAAFAGFVVQVPLALPPLMSGILLIYLIGPYTFLGRLFGHHLTDSMVGVVMAMTFVAAPFLIVAARAAFSAVDQGLLDVAATLGHSDIVRFLRVAMPVAGPGIRAGMLLAWLRAFGEYGAVVIVAYHPTSLPIYTYNQFSGTGLTTTLAPTALAIAVAIAAVLLSRIHLPRPSTDAVAPPTSHGFIVTVTEPVHFNIDHRLGSFNLTVAHESKGRHLAILGPSGSGKSALLKCLAGLYGPEVGDVRYGQRSVSDVPVERRRVGYVAQGFSLFPHLSVWQHLLFATEATPDVAAHWLKRLQLEGLENRRPSELSGGQRQRVGLAQVLCRAPRILLLDEPFSALDVPVRQELRRELRRLQRETGLATVLVTHDPEEAAYLSDEVIVIAGGRALQSGPSREVFTQPASPDVARLLGIANLAHATVVSRGVINASGVSITTNAVDLPPATAVLWSIRPENVSVLRSDQVERSSDGGLSHLLAGTLTDVADVGTAVDLLVAIAPDLEIQARVQSPIDLRVGEHCHVVLPLEAISVWAMPSVPLYGPSGPITSR
jgi:ABC-type Fe3+/spermidine/putrescine transport system ATPase subunit/ABC-type sulfate transport system permease component